MAMTADAVDAASVERNKVSGAWGLHAAASPHKRGILVNPSRVVVVVSHVHTHTQW